jgi:predicted RNA-binding Zn ribbon-like protein
VSVAARGDAEGVRFGGMQTAGGFRYELSGGRLCLDFANTLDERRTDRPRELIPRYEDLLTWSVQAAVISSAEGVALRRHAARHPRSAARTLGRAVEIRESIFGLFSAVARGHPLPARALATLDEVLPRALAARCIEHRSGQPVWGWRRPAHADLRQVLWPVVWSGAELLASPERGRVRACAGSSCRWLFMDGSKSGTRRWCDMSVCGNRAKARRHRAKGGAVIRSHHRKKTVASARSECEVGLTPRGGAPGPQGATPPPGTQRLRTGARTTPKGPRA